MFKPKLIGFYFLAKYAKNQEIMKKRIVYFLAGTIAFFEIINEAEIFSDSHIKIKRRGFGKETDLFLDSERMLENVKPVYHRASGGGGKIACEDIHGRGFA